MANFLRNVQDSPNRTLDVAPEEYALCHWDLLSVTSTNPRHTGLNRGLH